MTYSELLIALDINDPEAVLSSLTDQYNNLKYYGCYFIVCDDGDVHCFDKRGREQKIDNIPNFCFANQFFKKIIIPKTVTSIEYSAFYNCRELMMLQFPANIMSIGSSAFSYCTSLTNVIIPNSITSIGWVTFWGCNRLKSIVFKGKTMRQIKAMDYYPWGIEDMSVIQSGEDFNLNLGFLIQLHHDLPRT